MAVSTDMLEDVGIPLTRSDNMIALTPGALQYGHHTVQTSPERPMTLLSMHGPPGNSVHVGCSTTVNVSLLNDNSIIKSLVEEDMVQSDVIVEKIIDDPQLVHGDIQNELDGKVADIETMLASAPPPPENKPYGHKYPTPSETNPVDDLITIEHKEASELKEVQAFDVDKVCIKSPWIPATEVIHVPAVEDQSVPVEVSRVDDTVVPATHGGNISDNNIVTEVPRLPEEQLGLKQAVGDFFSNILPITKSSENVPSKETVMTMVPMVKEPQTIPSTCSPTVVILEKSNDEKEDVKIPSAMDKFFRRFSIKSPELESPEIVEVLWTPENIEVSEVSNPNRNVFEKEPLPYVPVKCSIGPLEPGPEYDRKSTFDKFVDIFSKTPEEDANNEVVEPEEYPAGPFDVTSVDVPLTAEEDIFDLSEPDIRKAEDKSLKELTVDITVPVSTEELRPDAIVKTSGDASGLVETPVKAATGIDVLGNFLSNILPYHPSTENIPTPVVERPTVTIEAEAQSPLAAVEIVPNGLCIDENRRSSTMDKFLHRFSISISPDTSMEDEVIIDHSVIPVKVEVCSPIKEKEIIIHSAPSAFSQLIGIFSNPEDDVIKETPDDVIKQDDVMKEHDVVKDTPEDDVIKEPVTVPNPPPMELQKEEIQSSLSIKDGELEVDNDRRSAFGGFIGKIDVTFFRQSDECEEEKEKYRLEVDPVLITETEDAPEPEHKKVPVAHKMSDFFIGILKPLIREEYVQEEAVKKTRTILRIRSSLESEEVEVIESLINFIKKDIKKKTYGDDDPFVVCDISQVFERKLQWDHQFPGIIMFYNLDAFNTLSIRVLLNALHCGFVCSNWCDIENALRVGVEPQKIVYQQPFKEKATLRRIVARGILIVCYTTSDVKLIGEMALQLEVKSNVLVQVDVSDGKEIQHPVTKGASPADMTDIIREACKLEVNIIGLSLDVSTSMSVNGCIIAKEVWMDLETSCSPSLIHIGGIYNDNGIASELMTLVLLEHLEDILYSPHIFVIGDLKGYLTKTSVSLVSCITESKETNNTLHLVLHSHINNDLWDQDSRPYVIEISKDVSVPSSCRTAVWDSTLGPPVILDSTLSMRLGDWVVFPEAGGELGKVKRRFVCSTPHDKLIRNLFNALNEENSV